MRSVTYAGRTFQTTNEVADALFDFVAALDRGSSGESIEFPVVTGDGLARMVRILVWPGVELICEADNHRLDPVKHDEFASEIRERIAQLRVVRDATVGSSSGWSFPDYHEFSDSEFGSREPTVRDDAAPDRHYGS